MEEIISALLEAERLNTRHAPIQRSQVLVQALVEQLIDTYFEREADRISIDIDEDPLEANIDHVRVALMLKNLVANAIRYAGGGPVRIEVSRDAGALVITVADEGPGLSPDQQENLAEPFYRGDPSRTRNTGGYGLGLYLARLVAEAHGGSLAVDTGYTAGAKLIATLPA